MFNQDFNEKIISSIKRHAPSNINLSEILKDILSLGREAIYRRLRGEVPFTISEVVKICKYFNLSLDIMLDIEQTSKAIFDVNIYTFKSILDAYAKEMENLADEIVKFRDTPDNYSMAALNIIPFSFYISLSQIPKFILFKWIYLMNDGNLINSLSDMTVPATFINSQKKLIRELLSIKKTTILLSPGIFKFFINNIKYFTRINFISEPVFLTLKEELESMITELEFITVKGKNRMGNEVLVYLSNIDFDTSYSFFGSSDFEYAYIRICTVNNISTHDVKICKLLKSWLHAMKKTATLITFSGDIQRRIFFEEQKDLIKEMDYESFHNQIT